MCLFLRLQLISPKLLTVLLPPVSQWTISTVYEFTQITCSELSSLPSQSFRFKLAKLRLVMAFLYTQTHFFLKVLFGFPLSRSDKIHKKHIRFSTLLRKPGKLIKPGIVVGSGIED